MTLKAPFPWFGGKSRVAEQVWERLGNPTVYVEPFAGSLAVLLARLGGAGPREIVCDIDGGLINFWRAVRADPEEVAYHADYPTFHHDLTARHRYLKGWVSGMSERLSYDPYFYDSEMAGWWVWGISLWIGGGWCTSDPSDRIPWINKAPGGRGVNAQRVKTPGHNQLDQIPQVSTSGGQGVAAQTVHDKRPHVMSHPGGQGVAAQVIRPDLLVWFAALQTRLKSVVVLNRSWESALTPTLLQQTETGPKSSVGILMDPPYITENRKDLYGSDRDGTSDQAAVESYRWAVENGDRFRIAYCAHKGDFKIPDGWDSIETTFGGIKDVDRRKERRDLIMFSPACKPIAQQSLFG